MVSNLCMAQPETVITYNLSTGRTDKVIPFGVPFLLIVDKAPSSGVKSIQAYEVYLKGNERLAVEEPENNPVKDLLLEKTDNPDNLQIRVPPLKPNAMFDIHVLTTLNEDCKKRLLVVNNKLSNVNLSEISRFHTVGEFSALDGLVMGLWVNHNIEDTYTDFKNCVLDKKNNIDGTSLNILEYEDYFSRKIAPSFKPAISYLSYKYDGGLSENMAKAVNARVGRDIADFEEGRYLIEVCRKNLWFAVQLGYLDINKVVTYDTKENKPFELFERITNLKSNLKYFIQLQQRLDEMIAKNIQAIPIDGNDINLNIVRLRVELLCQNILNNKIILSDYSKAIDKAIDENPSLNQSIYLSGNNRADNDLETEGGNLLFVDAGLSCIAAKNLSDKWAYIPKLYLGITIYFRPYDKNARDKDYPKKRELNPPMNRGRGEIIDGIQQYGPDYGILQRWSIWQHLALNVGVTLGSMNKKDFGNLTGDSSLLIGPAYRFYRGFKVSTGVSLLTRTSKNPIISDKKEIIGGYFSLSVDIDFLKSVKDVTTKLF